MQAIPANLFSDAEGDAISHSAPRRPIDFGRKREMPFQLDLQLNCAEEAQLGSGATAFGALFP